MKSKHTIITSILLTIITACSGGNNKQAGLEQTEQNLSGQYAKYFSISNSDSLIKTITIKNIWSGQPKDDIYTLVPRDCTQLLAKDLYTLPYPLEKIICMSSSHVAYLAALDHSNSIKGISGTRFVYNSSIQQLIHSGSIVDIGSEALPDYEQIMLIKPDVVIAYGISGANNSYIEKLQKLGVKVLTIGEYLENSPLGKMEYLKLFGELTGKRKMADSIYIHKANEYISLKNIISDALGNSSRTKVILNAPYNGIWYIPGEENYISQLIKDAGGIILGARKNEAQSAQLGFEQAYMYALQSDVWLHPNTLGTINEVTAQNKLFENIPALKNGRVYNNTLRNTAEGGSDFWETGAIEPHIILQDLAYILHPELFYNQPDLQYYIRLR